MLLGVAKMLQCLKLFTNTHIFLCHPAGTGDPYALSRPMTQAFLRDDILRGGEPTPENLQRATERILEELEEIFQSSFVSDTEAQFSCVLKSVLKGCPY